VWPPGSADTVCPRPTLTLTFECLILKLVCESHLMWGTFLSSFAFSNYSLCTRRTDRQTDRRTDGQTDKSNAYCPLPYGRGHNKQKCHSTTCRLKAILKLLIMSSDYLRQVYVEKWQQYRSPSNPSLTLPANSNLSSIPKFPIPTQKYVGETLCKRNAVFIAIDTVMSSVQNVADAAWPTYFSKTKSTWHDVAADFRRHSRCVYYSNAAQYLLYS